ncbi:histidine kinase [Pseudonocardia sp. CNS-139]|nr:histidine kinase [Pseudonocardia sp. CNS-139]
MDLTSHVDNLGHELAELLATGSPEAGALVERLGASLESAVRLTLLDALSAAADEITRDLAPGSVEIRLRGRNPDFVVTPPPAESAPGPAAAAASTAGYDATVAPDGVPGADEGATARINFRLPEHLKAAIEDAAARQGRSVNAWLVQVAAAALQQPGREHPADTHARRGAQRYTGWVR